MVKRSNYPQNFDKLTISKVIKAYLIQGLSHREIQREILNIPAPARGGGFIAMTILHTYNIHGESKHAGLALLEMKEYEEAKHIIESINIIEQEANEFYLLNQYLNPHDNPTESKSIVKKRIYQDKLRAIILNNYNFQCAICDINKSDLLFCSHIKPWKSHPETRLNPSNAICLCALHDRLFDKGYFSFDQNYNIIFTKKTDKQIQQLLNSLTFKRPKTNPPFVDFLRFHFESFH